MEVWPTHICHLYIVCQEIKTGQIVFTDLFTFSFLLSKIVGACPGILKNVELLAAQLPNAPLGQTHTQYEVARTRRPDNKLTNAG